MLPISVAGRQKTMTRMSAMAFSLERGECKFYFKLMGFIHEIYGVHPPDSQ